MKNIFVILPLVLAMMAPMCCFSQNQTDSLSPILSDQDLPFSLKVATASFSLPIGIQAYASAIHQGKWIFIGGKTTGLHDFSQVANNFPPDTLNSAIYVVDPEKKTTKSRSLLGSGLAQWKIDALSVVAPQFFQKKNTLYFVGGYGVNTKKGTMETKPYLHAIDCEALIKWVETGKPSITKVFKTVSHPILRVTGGALFQENSKSPFLLIFGQDFSGFYRGESNGIYTEQVRTFRLHEDGSKLSISDADISPKTNPDYRRRDLNIVPILHNKKPAYVAFAGVFTPSFGTWTVPVTIYPDGSSFEPSASEDSTFKQAMNQYNCAAFGLYSKKSDDMYVVFPGGISYGYFSGGTFQTDPEFPFINQITTVRINSKNVFTQHLMTGEFPYITSTQTNPGNQLLFGAGAQFFPSKNITLFKNGVLQLDSLPKKRCVIGYIVGGIMSTLPNVNFSNESAASPYVFKVIYTPKTSQTDQ